MLKSLEMHNYSSSASGGQQRPRPRPCCCLNFNASETSPLPFLSLQSPPRYTPPLSSTFILLWRVVEQEADSNDNSAHWESIHWKIKWYSCPRPTPQAWASIQYFAKNQFWSITDKRREFSRKRLSNWRPEHSQCVQFSTTLVCCPPPPCRLSSEPRPRTPGILNTVSIHPPSESRPLTSDMSPLCLQFKPLKLWPSEENSSIRSRGEVYPTWTPYSPHVNDTKTHAMYPIVVLSSCTASLVICHDTMHTHARHQHWDSSFHRLQPPISAFQSTKLDSLIRRPSLREKVQSIGIHF